VTPFKRISEFVICLMFAGAFLLLRRGRDALNPTVYRSLAGAILLTILSEMSFTFYVRATGLANLIGHVLKMAAFFLVYVALIAEQVRQRITTIRELEQTRTALMAGEQELREANAAKDKFFSIIAHDMRNPVGALQTISDLLLRRYDQLSDVERRRFCEMFHQTARQANGLMESLLSWAGSQTGRLEAHPETVCLKDLVIESLGPLRGESERKEIGISISIPQDLCVRADAPMIATVLRNLLSNAIKFTPRGGSVEATAEERESEVEVRIADTGVGLKPDELGRLFRIDESRSTEGTDGESGNGLGLLIAREFVEKNGGGIWAQSAPGTGSTFHFTLPRTATGAIA
jgi:signal transduction histidine kinase